ncbi:hypothetical protein G4B88_021467 [Cannabis sativa]|uniref:DUF4283 domain-containing protein n=1 Tax=Cannabis sativa TaxID=3483 RepID=A0A7J6DKM2_CANSA|nr:hypothetical protein G4B88_021467 [Cannabis sativa]
MEEFMAMPADGNETSENMMVTGVEELSISLEANLDLGSEAAGKSVVAKIISKRPIFNGLLRSVLGKKWKLAPGWKLQEVGNKTFILRLTKKAEAELIVKNGPWAVCDGFLVVKPMPEDGRWGLVDMDSSPIWVRVYVVPPRFWTQKNATAIANKIGLVISIDRMWRNGFPSNEYIRLRVSISLLKPLFVGLFLPMEEGGVDRDTLAIKAAAGGTLVEKNVVVPAQGHSGPQEKGLYVHEMEGQKDVVVGKRIASDMKVGGPIIFSNSGEKGKEIADVEESKVSHLAMVFNVVLDPRAQLAHKDSRPNRKGCGIIIKSNEEVGKKASVSGASGPGKKRRLEGLHDPALEIISEPTSARELNGGLKKLCSEPSKN